MGAAPRPRKRGGTGTERAPRAGDTAVQRLPERLEQLDREARALAREILAAEGAEGTLRSPEARAARARLERLAEVYAAGAELLTLVQQPPAVGYAAGGPRCVPR